MSKPPLDRLFLQMARMRSFEETAAAMWEEGLISGELHLGIGEEGIVAGVTDHLADGDAMALDHRGTPPLVARGCDLTALFLELLGHPDGIGAGCGGHMHLFDRHLLTASSGIVGASGPTACGLALAQMQLRPHRIAVAFFGEAALNQGMLMEALNLATVWKLPVVFIAKDNGWSISTRSHRMTAGDLAKRVESFAMPAPRVDGSDVGAVWRAAGRAIGRARAGKGPSCLIAACHRPRGHFEGDPLVLRVTERGTLLEDTRKMLRAAREPAPSIGPRVRGMRDVGRTIMAAAVDQRRRRDPLSRARRHVKGAPALADQAHLEVDAAATAARTRIAEPR